MKENDLFMQEALGYLDPELLEESEKAMGKKRRPVPVRVLMAAACICALLVVGTVAAEYTGIWVQVGDITFGGTVYIEGIDPENATGMGVAAPEGFSWGWASEELRATVADTPDREYKAYFNSQKEMEDFLGYTLPDNPVLDAAEESELGYIIDGDPDNGVVRAFASLHLSATQDGSLNSMSGMLSYSLCDPNHEDHPQKWESDDGVIHETPCRGKVNLQLEFFASVNDFRNIYITETDPVREDYVTPSGLPVVITQSVNSYDFGDMETYRAAFTVDNVGFVITLSVDPRCTDGEGVLKTVLDAFE